MKQSDDNKKIPMTSIDSGKLREVRPDVAYYTNQIVNLVMIGEPAKNWVLVDAGMPKSADEIIRVAEKRYGRDTAPSAIVLTHGHFDHVGGIVALLSKWDVPVYAHPLEFPYLTGEQDYPEPDSTVEGGMLAKLSFIYPHEAIDISENCTLYHRMELFRAYSAGHGNMFPVILRGKSLCSGKRTASLFRLMPLSL